MNLKGLLIILIMIILTVFFSKYYVCEIRCLCNETPIAAADTTDSSLVVSSTHYPLSYTWNNAMPIIDSTYYAVIDSIVSNAGTGNQVRLIGLYYAKEDTNSTFMNMGLVRARLLREQLAGRFDTSLFLIDAEMIEGMDSCAVDSFEAMKYEYVIWTVDTVVTQEETVAIVPAPAPAAKPAEKLEVLDNIDNVPLIQENDEISILRFPEGFDKEKSAQVNRFIDKLANDLRATRGAVLITGYSDNIGDDNVNLGLALKRADLLKQELVRKGVSENLILIESMGEANPIASNMTKAGRYKNRRLVIKKL